MPALLDLNWAFLRPHLIVWRVSILLLICLGCNRNPKSAIEQPGKVPQTGSSPRTIAETLSPSSIHFQTLDPSCGVTARFHSGSQDKLFSIIETLGGGVGVLDFDRDGIEDLFFVQGASLKEGLNPKDHAMYQGRGGLNWRDVTKLALCDSNSLYPVGVNIADYDCDGFQDVHITGWRGHQLFRNQGDGTWVDVTNSSGLSKQGWCASAAWCDVNGDGTLDLYATRYADVELGNEPKCATTQGERDVCGPSDYQGQADELYISAGEGFLQNCSERIQLTEPRRALGVAAGDWDEDGDIDLFVTNDAQPNSFFANRGDAVFEEIGSRSGTAMGSSGFPDGSMGIGVGDFDGNGLPDFLVTNFEGQLQELYCNQGRNLFRSQTRQAGLMKLGSSSVGWGTAWVDMELDGDEDLVLVTGHPSQKPTSGSSLQHSFLLSNNSNKRLDPIHEKAGEYFSAFHNSRGLATLDFDVDGLVDLVVTQVDDTVQLLRNNSNAEGKFLRIELIGIQSNRDGIGSIVTCKTSNKKLVRHRFGGGSFASTSSPYVHFGFPSGSESVSIEVRWPSGQVDELRNVSLDRTIQIVEAQSED